MQDAKGDPCPGVGTPASNRPLTDARLLAHLQVAARELWDANRQHTDDEPTDDEVREVLARFLRGDVVLANES